MTLNVAVEKPMPSPSVSTAVTRYPGCFSSARVAWRRSCDTVGMADVSVALGRIVEGAALLARNREAYALFGRAGRAGGFQLQEILPGRQRRERQIELR